MQNGRADWDEEKQRVITGTTTETTTKEKAPAKPRTSTARSKTGERDDGDGEEANNADKPADDRPGPAGRAEGGEQRGLGQGLGLSGNARGGGGASPPGNAPALLPSPDPASAADEGERAGSKGVRNRAPAEAAEDRKALEDLKKGGLESGVGDTTLPTTPPAQPAPPPATATARPVPTPSPRLHRNDPWSAPGPAASAAHGSTGLRGPVSVDGTASGGVRQGALVVTGGISQEEAMRIVRGAMPQMRACYNTRLHANSRLRGELAVDVSNDRHGGVKNASATRSTGDAALDACVLGVIRSSRFPAPGTGDARFSTTFTFVPGQGIAAAEPNVDVPPGPPIPGLANGARPNAPQAAPYEGRFKIVMDAIARGAKDEAFTEANTFKV
jgi:TonB family protein